MLLERCKQINLEMGEVWKTRLLKKKQVLIQAYENQVQLSLLAEKLWKDFNHRLETCMPRIPTDKGEGRGDFSIGSYPLPCVLGIPPDHYLQLSFEVVLCRSFT